MLPCGFVPGREKDVSVLVEAQVVMSVNKKEGLRLREDQDLHTQNRIKDLDGSLASISKHVIWLG